MFKQTKEIDDNDDDPLIHKIPGSQMLPVFWTAVLSLRSPGTHTLTLSDKESGPRD